MAALRVVLVGDHEVALSGTTHTLARVLGVTVVERAQAGHAPAPRYPGDVDVVVLEQSLGGRFAADRLAELAAACPGAGILSVVLRAGDEYAWVQVRPTGPLFAVEATGVGTLDSILRQAAAPSDPGRSPWHGPVASSRGLPAAAGGSGARVVTAGVTPSLRGGRVRPRSARAARRREARVSLTCSPHGGGPCAR